MFSLAGRSCVGAGKSVNQDAYCALTADSDLGPLALLVVCDGVGGLSSGELASATVVREFARWFEEDLCSYLAVNVSAGRVDLSGVAGVWTQKLEDLNRRIGAYGRAHGARLGTTFSGMLVCQGSYVLGQVGDCRVYCIRGGAAEQLTRDQTVAARLVEEGSLTKEEALSDPRGSVLLQSVGTQSELRPAFCSGRLEDSALYLLCCDGFYRRLGDAGIGEAFCGVDPADEDALERTVWDLMEQDMARGEKDNLTAVCFASCAGETATELLNGDDAATEVVGGDAATEVVAEAVAGGDDSATTTLGLVAGEEATTMLGTDEVASSFAGSDEPTALAEGLAVSAVPGAGPDEPTTLIADPDEATGRIGVVAVPAGPDDPTTTLAAAALPPSQGGEAPWRA